MKKPLIIVVGILLLLLGVIIYFFSYSRNNPEKGVVKDVAIVTPVASKESPAETPKVEHNLRLSIISPEGDTFKVRQARMYNALVEGNGKYANLVKCHWEFYLNQNNKEKLYQTMDGGGVLSGESKEMCGFTTTFIEAQGKLRVKLTLTVYDAVNDNLETISGEREYTVL